MADRGSIRATVFGATDVGRVREHNEDNLLVADLATDVRGGDGSAIAADVSEQGILLAVADGMGGAASGEIASATAVKTVYEMFRGREIRAGAPAEDIVLSLEASIRKANEEIYNRGQTESEHRGMGTTMTAVFVLADRVYIAQVGDSRAYLLRKGKLVQVTKDQSLISQLIEDGTLTEEEAERLGGRNIILQALGVEADVKVASKSVEVLDGDVLLLCSDGLSGMVHDAEILKILTDEPDLAKAARSLIEKANEGGGRDNVTVILSQFSGKGLRPPLQPLESEATSGGGAVGGFVAPEVPEVKKSPIVLIVLAIAALGVVGLALLLFLGGTGTVTFVFPGPNGLVRLAPEGGGETLVIRAGDAATAVQEIPTGSYVMGAEMPNHAPLDRFSLKVSRGASEIKVPLPPLPGRLALTAPAPWIRVVVRSEVVPSWRNEVVFAAPAMREVPGVPAGKVVLEVEREGFESLTIPAVMPPGGPLAITIADLKEVRGQLTVSCGVAGAAVLVTDAHDESIGTAVTGADGTARLSVRTGVSHAVEVTSDRYRKQRVTGVKVSADEPAAVRMTMVPLLGAIRVFGPVGSEVKLKAGDAVRGLRELRGEEGVDFDNLEPGRYRVVVTRDDKPIGEQEVDVKPAETAEVRIKE